MIIGILADTHDHLPRIEQAVDFFNAHEVGFVLHAGDFVAPFTLDKIQKLSCDWHGVFGNNDGEKKGLGEKSGGKITDGPFRKTIAGKAITVVHDVHSIDAAKEKADILIVGHTHKPEIIHEAARLIVNPGECCGWLSQTATVAIIDLDTLVATIHKL